MFLCFNMLLQLVQLIFMTILVLIFFTLFLLIIGYVLLWIRYQLTALYFSENILLSGEDAVNANEIDNACNIISIVVSTRDRVSVETMRNVVLSKILNEKDVNNKQLLAKLTYCLTYRAGYLMWSKENKFNVDDHVVQYDGQCPRDEEELKTLINNHCKNLFSPSKPLWEVLLIPLDYGQKDDPQTCILYRMHHCMADGISLARVTTELFGGNESQLDQLTKQMDNNIRQKITNSTSMMGKILKFILTIASIPSFYSKLIFDKYGHVFGGQKLSGTQIVDWTTSIKLDTVKEIKNATSTTVNDVIMSCVAGALVKYFARRGSCQSDFVTCIIPISLQGPSDPVQLKNIFSLVMTKLPIGNMDCIRRLMTTRDIMNQLKSSREIFTFHFIARYLFRVIPFKYFKCTTESDKVTLVVSNIPGPAGHLYLNGSQITSCFPLAPNNQIGLGIIIFSYAGNMMVSVKVDKAVIDSREGVRLLMDDFVEEIHQLHNSAMELPSTNLEKKKN